MLEKLSALLQASGIAVTDREWADMECTDFGLGAYAREGAAMITLVNTQRLALKVILLLPGQTLPEHWHVPNGDFAAKEETVRVAWGQLNLYTPGEGEGHHPAGKSQYYTCGEEHILRPGQQVFLAPGVKHYFTAGEKGCVAWSISSVARDLTDRFTDPGVDRSARVSLFGK